MQSNATINTVNLDRQVGPTQLRVVNGNSAFTATTDASSGPPSPSIPITTPKRTNGKVTGSGFRFGDPTTYIPRVEEVSERHSDKDPTPTSSPTGTIRIRNSLDLTSIPDDTSTSGADHGHANSTSLSQLSHSMSISSSRAWMNTQAGLTLIGGYGTTGSTLTDLANAHLPESIPEDGPAPKSTAQPPTPIPAPPIEPSIATLDKAASTKIYFENIYFPILRQPPSRDQREVALERDLAQMVHLTEVQKEEIRERWRKNETEYLREKRRKVSAEAFTKLKVIGHGAFGIVSLVKEHSTGQLYAMKQVSYILDDLASFSCLIDSLLLPPPPFFS